MRNYRKPRTCDCVGCSDQVAARGLCCRHYTQERKGWTLQRRGESVPRTNEPWEYRNDAGEAELAERYGRNANV